MTVAEILEQAKTLSVEERKELAKQLIDTLDAGEPITQAKTGQKSSRYWKLCNRLSL